MLDQSRVTSGCDIEILLGERHPRGLRRPMTLFG